MASDDSPSPRARATSIGDNWTPERLGLHMKNPLHGYSERLAHKQGQKDPRKNSFNLEFFRSKDCRSLLKIAFGGAVRMTEEGGQHRAVASRYVREGEIVERGILRAVDEAALCDHKDNPFILRLGHDFLLGLPWSIYSDRPGPPFLASGQVMTYRRSSEDFNVELTVRESHVEGFEFDVVAVKDIAIGEALRRRVSPVSQQTFPDTPSYGEMGHMSVADAEKFVAYQGVVDEKLAAKNDTPLPPLHTEVILEHARLTSAGTIPIVNCTRSVCLPHPLWNGYGVFASENIRKGEIVESGLMHELKGLDGNRCPYVFTWNKDGQRKPEADRNQWCTGGGHSMFYNSDVPANCRMYRFHDHFRYLIVATEDIAEGEELMHLYLSSSWRTCFVEDSALPKLYSVEDPQHVHA